MIIFSIFDDQQSFCDTVMVNDSFDVIAKHDRFQAHADYNIEYVEINDLYINNFRNMKTVRIS